MSLELIKQRFNAVTAGLLIRGDVSAQKILVAWTLYRPEFVDSPFRAHEDETLALRRYWQDSRAIDFKRLGEIAGLPETRAERAFNRMKSALLLWPDGTVAGQAQMVLIAESRSYLRHLGLVPRAPIATPPKTPPAQSTTEAVHAREPDAPKNKKSARTHRGAAARRQAARP